MGKGLEEGAGRDHEAGRLQAAAAEEEESAVLSGGER